MAEPPPNNLSPDEFAAGFRRAAPALWCVAAAVLGTRDGAEDAVQDAALQAMGKLDTFCVGTDFTAWMATFVRYTALNQLRKTRRGPRALSEEAAEPAAPAFVEAAVSSRGQVLPNQSAFDDDVAGGLQSLSEIERTCLLLKVVVGLPYSEIASVLAVPEGTAMSHVHRARQQLMDRLRSAPVAQPRPRRMR